MHFSVSFSRLLSTLGMNLYFCCFFFLFVSCYTFHFCCFLLSLFQSLYLLYFHVRAVSFSFRLRSFSLLLSFFCFSLGRILFLSLPLSCSFFLVCLTITFFPLFSLFLSFFSVRHISVSLFLPPRMVVDDRSVAISPFPRSVARETAYVSIHRGCIRPLYSALINANDEIACGGRSIARCMQSLFSRSSRVGSKAWYTLSVRLYVLLSLRSTLSVLLTMIQM